LKEAGTMANTDVVFNLLKAVNETTLKRMEDRIKLVSQEQYLLSGTHSSNVWRRPLMLLRTRWTVPECTGAFNQITNESKE
jgi:hypothetical protein